MSRKYKEFLAIVSLAWMVIAAGCDTGSSTAGGNSPGAPVASTPAIPSQPEPAAPEERPVVAETLPYAEIEQQLVYGHFAFPADMVDPLPGVIVIHERWGLDDSTRMLSERLAAQGYVVLAIDLFAGQVAEDAAASRKLMLPIVENPEMAYENIRQAHQFLIESGQAPRIALLGWSFGGTQAVNAAMELPDLFAAAVLYYGQVSTSEERLAELAVPVLAIYGENDRGFTVDKVSDFEAAMDNLGKDYQVELYVDVGHGFADPYGANYNADVAEQAWVAALAFLGQYLVDSPN